MKKVNVAKEVERLLQYALKHKLIEKWDVISSRNTLLDLLNIDEPYDKVLESENFHSVTPILNNILDYANECGLLSINTTTYRDLLDSKIMGLLMPRQSEIVNKFYNIYNTEGAKKATEYYYNLSTDSNYIRIDRTNKNLYWKENTPYGDIEITINLSKPEKDPRDIAASKLKENSNYPKCLLCLENVGYAGHVNHPGRQNHRVIPINLGEEQWYLQYSPYVYYNEHSILFYEKHIPMSITEKTFERIVYFLDQFPHYFIGSNADLPIVGGSILNHEHYQGGKHTFPMVKAPIEYYFENEEFIHVKGGIVKWPMSVIRLSSKNKNQLIFLSNKILNLWREYKDEALEILPYSMIQGEKFFHNTITPIGRINSIGEYEIDLVLRNNRTNEEHPYGIFHPHSYLHHIKKENIGLIEVMGLAVLPGRLNEELKEIENILMEGVKRLDKIREDENSNMKKHLFWIESMIYKYENICTKDYAKEIIKREIGEKFIEILSDAGVFKRDKDGMEGFIRFMKEIGFKYKG
ncbi:UDP-glucose--hexose-1-phosphate uridylyltransferase [uncultured Clostridium sp.]|uniref:UDP-glucose--hexose-1-phosphate uridylyltransferase n=1 Tax=uncultured Clostridium sp. TaxID=59620 RepID=UPI0028EF158E|nr:UDP-glucose--hexose-1-phosphate uridylyltransferase [uncultured Clostridium sp.]